MCVCGGEGGGHLVQQACVSNYAEKLASSQTWRFAHDKRGENIKDDSFSWATLLKSAIPGLCLYLELAVWEKFSVVEGDA